MGGHSSGGGPPAERDKGASIEYAAQLSSPLFSGDVRLTIGKHALTITALFDAVEILYAEMNELILKDYAITVDSDSGEFVFSMMGRWCQPFYDALSEAYNKAVLRSLFVKGAPILPVKGDCIYSEGEARWAGEVSVHVYEHFVVSLPGDLGARRVPLCFVTGMEKGSFILTLTLDTGETCSYSKLGYDTDIFAEAVERQIRDIREKTIGHVKELDPALPAIKAGQVAKLMPLGAAASFGQISGIAPSFAAALESKIMKSRAAEPFGVFKELCDPGLIYIGFRKNENPRDEHVDSPEGVEVTEPEGKEDKGEDKGGGTFVPGPDADAASADPYLLWLVAPSPGGEYAAVEFAEPNSATFVYRTGGDFEGFARQLSRALEAIDFKREVIRLSDEELREPGNEDYYMASKRTAALIFIRSNFVGRVIHSSVESWRSKLAQLMGTVLVS